MPVSWRTFAEQMLSRDGRVIDFGTPDRRTTSEAQAYGLLMALIWNDQKRFARILDWTENNLAQGDLRSHLPAWLWGKAKGGQWHVLDANSASDADLWISYTLLEAGRLWGNSGYRETGRILAERILRRETREFPLLGRVLLPAPQGFADKDGGVRVSPSYLPLQVLRRLAALFPSRPWGSILDSSATILLAHASGLQSDWVVLDAHGNIHAEAPQSRIGGYNAIRAYLWTGMLSPRDPLRNVLIFKFKKAADLLARLPYPPEKIDTWTGKPEGRATPLLASALLPLFHSLGRSRIVEQFCARLPDHTKLRDGYYSQALALFALGWLNGHYRFAADGRLVPVWKHD
jgi:endoglucanase